MTEQEMIALNKLRTVAVMLLNSCQGCAMSHYGEDFQLYGMPGWLADAEEDIAAASAILTTLEASRTPEGMVLVPREPTEAMIEAGERAWMNRNLNDARSSPLKDCYSAMLSASPQPKEG